MPAGNGYVALFCAEAPEPVFHDIVRVPVRAGYGHVRMDPTFLEVCHPGTIGAVGWTTDRPASAGIEVKDDGTVEVSTDAPVTLTATVLLMGTRRGHVGRRFEPKTWEQMVRNTKFWSAAQTGRMPGP